MLASLKTEHAQFWLAHAPRSVNEKQRMKFNWLKWPIFIKGCCFMQVTATQAKNRFGYFCAQAKSDPVFVEKDGRPDSVIVSYENYRALKESAVAASTMSMAQRKKEFNETYKDWIAEQHRIVEEFGVFGEESRPW